MLPWVTSIREGNHGEGSSALATVTVHMLGVESSGGISPPGAHRTVREPLNSYGSSHEAAPDYKPVGKHVGLTAGYPRQPVDRASLAPA